MPYSGADDPKLPSNVRGKPAAKRRQWVAIWSAEYEQCVAAGWKLGECEGRAFRMANGAIREGENDMAETRAAEAANQWKVGAARDLPVADTERAWDGSAAKGRIFGLGQAQWKRAFLVYDAGAPDLKGSYKLPFADVMDGRLRASPAGLRAAASRLPQTDAPEAVLARARAVLDAYFGKMAGERTREMVEARLKPAPGPDFQGHQWDVVLIGPREPGDVVSVAGREYVRGYNRMYLCDALEASVPLWEGVKVYDNHLTNEEFRQRQGMRSVAQEWAGTIVAPKWDASARSIKATLKLVDEPLARKLKNALDQDVLKTIGLSIDTKPVMETIRVGTERVAAVLDFQKIHSVDIVANPAAGGIFDRMIAAQNAEENTDMDITKEQVQGWIAEAFAAAEAAAEAKRETERVAAAAEAKEAEAKAAEEAEEDEPKAGEEKPSEEGKAQEGESSEGDEAKAEGKETAPEPVMERMRKLECQILLDKKLDAAKLPPELRRTVETAFEGRVFEAKELGDVIDRAKEAQAANDKSGDPKDVGGTREVIRVGAGPNDKAEIEFMRLVAGNAGFRALEHVEDDFVQERVPESYREWIKGGRKHYGTRRVSEWVYNLLGGDPLTDQRAYEAVTTSSMSSIVKNALNVMLAADYARRHRWWEPLVRTEEVDTIDAATLVRLFGLSSLSVVDEGQAYTELSWVDEEETAAFVKKGNYVGVTLETLLSDKVQAIRTIPNRLSTSWFNTISALVSGVFTTNTAAGPALASGGALFNATAVTTVAGHANLLTAALSFTAFGAARTAMMKQTDQTLGTGQKLLIGPRFLLVPVDLETTALQIRNSEHLPASANNDINPYYQKFDVVVVPNWTDTNNWALVGDPTEFPAIWLIFLRGKQVPELFTSDSEVQGAMFTNDTLRYKVRMLTFRFSSTYDCAPVSDFRPVHKSNL